MKMTTDKIASFLGTLGSTVWVPFWAFVLVASGLLGGTPEARAEICPSPIVQPSWCDGSPERYLEGVLCIASPIDVPGSGNIDDEFIGGDVCITGKFRSPALLRDLIDFVVAYDFLAPADATPEEILAAPFGVFSPQFGDADFQTFADTGEFRYRFPLDNDGMHDIAAQVRLLTYNEELQSFDSHDIGIQRRVVRITAPHMTVSGAQSTGTSTTGSPGFQGIDPTDTDGDGLPDRVEDANGNGEVDDGETNPNDPDTDDDNACDGPNSIDEGCSGTSDPARTHYVDLTPLAGDLMGEQVAIKRINLCVLPHETPGHEPTFAGSQIAVHATNNVTDTDSIPGETRTITLNATCVPDGAGEEGVCPQVTGGSCNGGYTVNIPMAHGSNKITLTVENRITGYSGTAAQQIDLGPIENDLKGPKITVNFLNSSGGQIDNVDGKVLKPSEAAAPTIDIEVGEELGETPDDCGVEVSCLELGTAPITIQFQNDANCRVVCPEGGARHYRVVMDSPRFPVSTLTITARDPAGNITKETHGFAYGDVRSLYDAQGEFSLASAMVPDGVGAFLTDEYIETEVRTMLLQILNTQKFKNGFFKLMDPLPPNDDEIACLEQLEEDLPGRPCELIDRYAARDKSWRIAIKAFCGPLGTDDDDEDNWVCNNIGSFEIPSLWLLNRNRIRIQLRVIGQGDQAALGERAEMYTCRFKNSDCHEGDETCDEPDAEDDDDDNDGICDKDKAVHGVCGLDPIPDADQGECPDFDPLEDDLDDYEGCSDQDDDGDGIPDEDDTVCELMEDPDFGTYIIPVRFAVRELLLNLDVEIQKDPATQLLKLHISPVPAEDEYGRREIVEFSATDGGVIHFDCNKRVSEFQHGDPNFYYNDGIAHGANNCGRNVCIDQDACDGLQALDALLRGAVGSDFVDDCVVTPDLDRCLINLAERDLPGMGRAVDPRKRKYQNVDQQFWCTMQAQLRCTTPAQLNAQLDDFEINLEHPDQTKKVAAISQELLDKRFHFDFFAPIGSSDLFIDPVGLGFAGQGVLLPAGVTEPEDKAERDAADFLTSELPAEFQNDRFGPVYEQEAPEEDRTSPIEASFNMGSEISLALKEETVNSLLHAINVTLFDLNRDEEAAGDEKRTLDLDTWRLRVDNGMAAPNINGEAGCFDENGINLNPARNDPDPLDDWKCFPFSLDLSEIFGGIFDTIDFNGDGRIEPDIDSSVPVLFRTRLNPFLAPTAHVVSVSAIDTFGGDGATRSHDIFAELELGITGLEIAIFEEEMETVDGIIRCVVDRETERCKIKDWCGDNRFPGMDPRRCTGRRDGRRISPMFTFSISGRIFLTLRLDTSRPGLLKVRAGVSSVDGPTGATLDDHKTFLAVSVLENNTILPDEEVRAALEPKLMQTLSDYSYGGRDADGTTRTIVAQIPTMMPVLRAPGALESFCERHPDIRDVCKCLTQPEDEDCDSVEDLEEAWDDLDLEEFGIHGFEVQEPVLGVTGAATYSDDPADLLGSPRYLTVGIGTCIKDAEGDCIGEEAEEEEEAGTASRALTETRNFFRFRSIMNWARNLW